MQAKLDAGSYPKGVKVSDKQMKELEERVLDRHVFHGEWNYTVLPVSGRPRAASTQGQPPHRLPGRPLRPGHPEPPRARPTPRT